MKNPFAKDDIKTAQGRIQSLEARLSIAAQDVVETQNALGYASAATTHAGDADLVKARTAARAASDLAHELTAGLEVARQALAEAEARKVARQKAALARTARKLRTKEGAAAREVDAALANLGVVYMAFLRAKDSADTAAQAARPGARRLNVNVLHYVMLGSIWHHVPTLAKLLELPFRSAGKRRALLDALSNSPREAVANSPNPPPAQADTVAEAQATA